MLANWVGVWALTAVLILVIRSASRLPGSGLIQAYLLNLALLYWIGAALYLLPWYTNHDPDVVLAGLQQSTYAVIAFGIGSVILAPWLTRAARPLSGSARFPTEPALARRLAVIGLVAFFGLTPLVARIPTVSAVAVQGWNLLVVGLGLLCWQAWHSKKHRGLLGWLSLTLCLPLVTIVTQGFIGYGTAAATAVMTFIGNFYRPRWRVVLVAVLLTYLGLSMYVTYMRDRDSIRAVVWSGQPLGARVERVQLTLSTFEWFDWYNHDHLERIDDRLNQNLLMGAAVQYMDAGLAHFAYGATIVEGFIALVPRAIWPTKPVVAGSGTVVTEYTGIPFAQGTAIGIGHVMEAYISFGTIGVVVGFIFIGIVVGLIDFTAARRLWSGDVRGFLLWFLPGLSFLQVGGSIVELTSSVGAAILAAHLVNRLLARPESRRTAAAQPTLVVRRT
ncbi:MAG: hypothetical protein JO020_02115 [Chloroflexi bacterium]|nr:hypothetical protein [Chloroflexota bacterium]MBV9892944.1 hypothetical protein [Chloroflexota bacterium]